MTNDPQQDPPLFLHVGLHKTGSTFLQHEVFPKLKSLQFIHRGEAEYWLNRLGIEEDSSFDLAPYQRFFYPLISSGPTLISHEGLSGAHYLLYVNQTRSADRLAQLFPHASIILGIRRQDSLLLSLYLHTIRSGGTGSLADYLGYEKGRFRERYSVHDHQVSLPMFRFDHIAKLYSERFGGRVYFLVYEQMRQAQDEFLKGICHYLGEAEVPAVQNIFHNKGYGYYQLQAARVLNRFFATPNNPDKPIPGFWLPGVGMIRLNQLLDHRLTHRAFSNWYKNKVQMPESMSRAILEYYSPYNTDLETKWDLGLRRWGYILDDAESTAFNPLGERVDSKNLAPTKP